MIAGLVLLKMHVKSILINDKKTSVIINYKKQPGEVSQTILISNDANDTIKGAVGNIFKTLNVDLQ